MYTYFNKADFFFSINAANFKTELSLIWYNGITNSTAQ